VWASELLRQCTHDEVEMLLCVRMSVEGGFSNSSLSESGREV